MGAGIVSGHFPLFPSFLSKLDIRELTWLQHLSWLILPSVIRSLLATFKGKDGPINLMGLVMLTLRPGTARLRVRCGRISSAVLQGCRY